jgi:hypothetical protein
MTSIRTVQSIDIAAAPGVVFAAACAIDAPAVIRKSVVLPGVAAVSGHSAPWTSPGQRRVLTLTDGASVAETLLSIEEGAYEYRVAEFTGPFAALVSEARGRFWTEPTNAGATLLWSYGFQPASPAAAPLVRFIAGALWPGYMQAALKRIKAGIEGA